VKFSHSDQLWQQFSNLRALAMVVRGVTKADKANADIEDTLCEVGKLLDEKTESELPPIKAWRQTYSAMGYKATQYRCASEALLRRFRKTRELPRFHPLVDMLNAESMASAIPIAVFDIAHVQDGITVRHATGSEVYKTFKNETEHPDEDEIVFADSAGNAHSRRWVYRQSALSAVRASSDSVLVVAETLHDEADQDLKRLNNRIEMCASKLGIDITETTLITPENRQLEFAAP